MAGVNLCLCFILISFIKSYDSTKYTDKVMIKIKEKDSTTVKATLQKNSYTFLYEIVPGILVFRKKDLTRDDLQAIKDKTNGMIEDVEQVRRISVSSQSLPQPRMFDGSKRTSAYGMGILDAWKENLTGKGVTVAVLDVGVTTKHPYLQPNIDLELSYNYVDDTTNAEANFSPNYQESFQFADHGNNMCGIIASAESDDTCSKGAAYEAKLAALKIAAVIPAKHCLPCLDDDQYALGLAHKPDDISIYCSGLGYNTPFEKLDMASRSVLERGVKTGRHGKGSVYVYPAGAVGNGFVNNPYTIAVNGIGIHGDIAKVSSNNAAALTSALADGNTISTEGVVTTSGIRDNNCTTKFGGLSASTAFVSAICTYALQANQQLTWRDILYIIVESSSKEELSQEADRFKTNGAGKEFHPVYGFGQLNASKVGRLASAWKPVDPMISIDAMMDSSKASCNNGKCTMTAQVVCNNELPCVQKIEQVLITVSFSTPDAGHTSVFVISPSGTKSLLLDKKQLQENETFSVEHFMLRSVHFWGESAATGSWKVILDMQGSDNKGSASLSVSSFTVYGTGTLPLVKDPGSAFGATLAMMYPIIVFFSVGVFFYVNR